MKENEKALVDALVLQHRETVRRFHACEAHLRRAGAHRQMRELDASLEAESRQVDRLLKAAGDRPALVLQGPEDLL